MRILIKLGKPRLDKLKIMKDVLDTIAHSEANIGYNDENWQGDHYYCSQCKNLITIAQDALDKCNAIDNPMAFINRNNIKDVFTITGRGCVIIVDRNDYEKGEFIAVYSGDTLIVKTKIYNIERENINDVTALVLGNVQQTITKGMYVVRD